MFQFPCHVGAGNVPKPDAGLQSHELKVQTQSRASVTVPPPPCYLPPTCRMYPPQHAPPPPPFALASSWWPVSLHARAPTDASVPPRAACPPLPLLHLFLVPGFLAWAIGMCSSRCVSSSTWAMGTQPSQPCLHTQLEASMWPLTTRPAWHVRACAHGKVVGGG